MLKRGVAICLAMLTLVLAVGIAAATTPSGPRLAVLKQIPDRAQSQIATLDPAGGGYRRLVASPQSGPDLGLLSAPAWSPDGTLLAFSHRQGRHWGISLVPSNGGSSRLVSGTRGGFLPVFSPDGRSLAFTRVRHERKPGRRSYELFESSSVWLVDLATGERRQLTRWYDHLEQIASSFSPDGSTLLVTRSDRRRSGEPETVALRFDGRTSSLLVGEGILPVYSPDGTQIALFREDERRIKKESTPLGMGWRVEESSELYVVDADGSHLRRLTHTPHRDEIFASWDPSSERIAYSSYRGGFEPGSEASVMEINADGSCPTEVLSQPGVAFVGPVWQPGPGREAGRIDC